MEGEQRGHEGGGMTSDVDGSSLAFLPPNLLCPWTPFEARVSRKPDKA